MNCYWTETWTVVKDRYLPLSLRCENRSSGIYYVCMYVEFFSVQIFLQGCNFIRRPTATKQLGTAAAAAIQHIMICFGFVADWSGRSH